MMAELSDWKKLRGIELTRKWYLPTHVQISRKEYSLYTDASSHQMGSVLELANGKWDERQFMLTAEQSQEKIALKELYAIIMCIDSHGHDFDNSRLHLHCDNQNVVKMIENYGCRDNRMNRHMKGLMDKLKFHNIKLTVVAFLS